MNVVDSSAWLEYLVDSERASLFAEPIERTRQLIVPVLVIYELFKKVLRERGEQPALEVYGLLSQGNVVDVDAGLATAAARFPLPLADSIIYATAQRHSAILWTQDEHFEDLPGVKFFPKRWRDGTLRYGAALLGSGVNGANGAKIREVWDGFLPRRGCRIPFDFRLRK